MCSKSSGIPDKEQKREAVNFTNLKKVAKVWQPIKKVEKIVK